MPDPGVSSDKLIRAFVDCDVRTDAAGRTICGLAVPFDRPANIGTYTEAFRRGAFARTIAERGPERVKFLSQHDQTVNPIGRAHLLREDTAGLYAELRVSKTAAGDEALELVRDGVLDSLSVGFRPIAHVYDQTRDLVVRTEVRLDEVSLVTWPAYDDALVSQIRAAVSPLVSLDLARRRAALAATLAGVPRP